jgi:hypothetical protein
MIMTRTQTAIAIACAAGAAAGLSRQSTSPPPVAVTATAAEPVTLICRSVSLSSMKWVFTLDPDKSIARKAEMLLEQYTPGNWVSDPRFSFENLPFTTTDMTLTIPFGVMRFLINRNTLDMSDGDHDDWHCDVRRRVL